MTWSRVSAWAEISDCGRYTVGGSRSEGGYVFLAWKRSERRGEPPVLLRAFRGPEAVKLARECCEDDLQKVAA